MLGMNTLLKGVGFARFLVSESTPRDYSTEILAIERAQRCKFSSLYYYYYYYPRI